MIVFVCRTHCCLLAQQVYFRLPFAFNSEDAIFSTSFLHGRGNSSVFFHFDARLAMQREIRKILLLLL